MSLDTTSELKTQVRFRSKNLKKFKELLRKTYFDAVELDAIFMIYFKLQCDLGPSAQHISRMQFRSVLYKCFDMAEDCLIDRIMVALDKGVTPFVTVETWSQTMSLYLRGTLDERIVYCFVVYDIIGNGQIRRDQIIALMRKSIIKHHSEDVEEAIKDFADIIIKKFDVDLDGAISFRDFQETVKQQPALLESLGPCIPNREAINAFLSTFTQNIVKF